MSAASAAQPPQPVTIVAHRGLTEGMPENTIAAFQHAVANGVTVIELDIRSTKDGQLIVIHDAKVDRTTNGSGRVSDLTLDQVKALSAGGATHPDQRIPTFAEALAFARSNPVRLVADVKAGTPLDAVISQVRESKAEARIILGLRRAKDVSRVRAELPAVTILAFIPEPTDAPAFASRGAHIIRLRSDWIDADPSHIGRVRALGPEVWIMVGRKLPSSKSEWRALHSRMLATEAQGLITDRPELVER
jgi:glycerophosphoryl diester phosphodiesterase